MFHDRYDVLCHNVYDLLTATTNRSQWSSGNVPNSSACDHTIDSHDGQFVCLLQKTAAIYSRGHGLYTVTVETRSTQTSTFHGQVK